MIDKDPGCKPQILSSESIEISIGGDPKAREHFLRAQLQETAQDAVVLKEALADREQQNRQLQNKVDTLESVLYSIAQTCSDSRCDSPDKANPGWFIQRLLRIEHHARKFIPARDISVYDIIPQFDSYIADLKNTLDEESLERYNKDRRPFMRDLLGDHGARGWTEEEIRNAVDKHEGKI